MLKFLLKGVNEMGVGNNIRTFRMIAGMTQEELAEKTGYKSRL